MILQKFSAFAHITENNLLIDRRGLLTAIFYSKMCCIGFFVALNSDNAH